MTRIQTLAIAISLAAGIAALTQPAAALSSRYGCYEVTAGSLNIREKAWSSSKVLAVATRGFCALRGFWCPVTTEDGVEGWAGKQFLKRTAC
jgi:hypothetical protein